MKGKMPQKLKTTTQIIVDYTPSQFIIASGSARDSGTVILNRVDD